MNRTLNINRSLINFGIPLILLGILVFLMKSSILPQNSAIGLAITLDLLLTVPLVYFLLIRKSNIPKTTVVPVMIVGLLIGSTLLPAARNLHIDYCDT